jgi:opacity protein-like surface antigen
LLNPTLALPPETFILAAKEDLVIHRFFCSFVMRDRQGGYNWQTGPWVLGIEGDFDFADNINFLASARGRLGWALGNWLFYGTGGVAFTDSDNDFVVVSADDGPFSFSGGNNDTGFVVGGGIDYKVAPHLSLGVEASSTISVTTIRILLPVTSRLC